MKIYEKPLAIVNKFEVEDVIATSGVLTEGAFVESGDIFASGLDKSKSTVVFEW